MLVLSRRIQQQLVIDQHITVTVLGVKGRTVRLGIEAPGHVKIIRREIEFDPPATAEATPATAPPPAPAMPPAARERAEHRASRMGRSARPQSGQIPTEWRVPASESKRGPLAAQVARRHPSASPAMTV